MALNPLQQFEIREIYPLHIAGYDLSITNQSLWMLLAVGFISLLFLMAARKPRLIPGRLQAFAEITMDFIQSMVKDTAGKEALSFMPLIFTVFLFVAALNVSGMIPFSFTSTSQILLTGFMAGLVFIMVVTVGFYKQGIHFFTLFYPKGTPLVMAPFIIVLEIISFLARPFTLSIRLAANMVAGHVLLKIFGSFCVMLVGYFFLPALLPGVMLVLLSGLELFVALLQAYIFTILTVVYLNDSLHGH